MGQLLKWSSRSSIPVLLKVNLRAARKTKNLSLSWASLRPYPKIILTTPTSTLTSEAKSKSFRFAARKRLRNVWHVRSKQLSKIYAKRRTKPRDALILNQRKRRALAVRRWLPNVWHALRIRLLKNIAALTPKQWVARNNEFAARQWHLRALPALKASLLMSTALKIQVSGVALDLKKSHGCAAWLWLQAASLVRKEFQLKNTVN
jgi:hypothetical protein